MKVKCKCCGKKIDKNDGIRVPAIVNNEHGSFYYCSAKCLGNGLTIKCEGAIVDLTDEQLGKIADILAQKTRVKMTPETRVKMTLD